MEATELLKLATTDPTTFASEHAKAVQDAVSTATGHLTTEIGTLSKSVANLQIKKNQLFDENKPTARLKKKMGIEDGEAGDAQFVQLLKDFEASAKRKDSGDGNGDGGDTVVDAKAKILAHEMLEQGLSPLKERLEAQEKATKASELRAKKNLERGDREFLRSGLLQEQAREGSPKTVDDLQFGHLADMVSQFWVFSTGEDGQRTGSARHGSIPIMNSDSKPASLGDLYRMASEGGSDPWRKGRSYFGSEATGRGLTSITAGANPGQMTPERLSQIAASGDMKKFNEGLKEAGQG